MVGGLKMDKENFFNNLDKAIIFLTNWGWIILIIQIIVILFILQSSSKKSEYLRCLDSKVNGTITNDSIYFNQLFSSINFTAIYGKDRKLILIRFNIGEKGSFRCLEVGEIYNLTEYLVNRSDIKHKLIMYENGKVVRVI